MVTSGEIDAKMPMPAELDAPLTDNVTRWMSRMLGYASLAGACAGIAKLVF